MKGNRAVLAAVVAVVLIAGGWWLFRRGSGAPTRRSGRTAVRRERAPADRTFQRHGRQPQRRIAQGDRGRAADAHHLEGAHSGRRVVARECWDEARSLDGGRGRRAVLRRRLRRPHLRQAVRAGRQPVQPSGRPQVDPGHGRPRRRMPARRWRSSSTPATARTGKPHDPRNDFALWGAPEIISK